MRSILKGTGSFLPHKVITNDDLASFLDTSDEWIQTRTGIKQRHVVDPSLNETTMTMGLEASKKALARANVQPEEIDLIITATLTPDYRMPSVSCMLQGVLDARNAGAFDLNAACSGSLYALSIADSFIRNGTYKNILVVASETMSSVIDWQDRNTAILFGDGASAAVVGRSESDRGFVDFDLYADGRQQKVITVLAGGMVRPIDEKAIKEKADKVFMNGREVYKFAVRAVTDAIQKIIHENNIDISQITFAVPHQANLRIIEAIAERMNIPIDRFLINLDRCANTSAASLLMAYDEASQKGRIKENDLLLMLAIGAGFVWGASLYRA